MRNTSAVVIAHVAQHRVKRAAQGEPQNPAERGLRVEAHVWNHQPHCFFTGRPYSGPLSRLECTRRKLGIETLDYHQHIYPFSLKSTSFVRILTAAVTPLLNHLF